MSLSILARFFCYGPGKSCQVCVCMCVLVFSRAFCELVHLDERFLLSIEIPLFNRIIKGFPLNPHLSPAKKATAYTVEGWVVTITDTLLSHHPRKFLVLGQITAKEDYHVRNYGVTVSTTTKSTASYSRCSL